MQIQLLAIHDDLLSRSDSRDSVCFDGNSSVCQMPKKGNSFISDSKGAKDRSTTIAGLPKETERESKWPTDTPSHKDAAKVSAKARFLVHRHKCYRKCQQNSINLILSHLRGLSKRHSVHLEILMVVTGIDGKLQQFLQLWKLFSADLWKQQWAVLLTLHRRLYRRGYRNWHFHQLLLYSGFR